MPKVPPPLRILPIPIRDESAEIPFVLIILASGAEPQLKYPAKLEAPYTAVSAPSSACSLVTNVLVPKYKYPIIIRKGISCFSTEFVTA